MTTGHLTQPDKALHEKIRATVPGMAHWAGSGPEGMTCRQCEHWSPGGADYFNKRGMHGGGLKPARCAKYSAMMQGAEGGKIPHSTAACKYFEASKNPPSLTGK